ncbi:hypothetical protein I3843_Q057600 [Carya illinoinensis]|nr:hypothetical protein I3843_Q057600 [Carya illinoinensis]
MVAEAEIVCQQSATVLDVQCISASQTDIKGTDKVLDATLESSNPAIMPTTRSGSFADIGPRRYMEDEHIRVDDLSSHLVSVFDGHGGPEAAAYIRKNVIRLFFEDVDFPQASEVDEVFLEEGQPLLLLDIWKVYTWILLVANAGDCRAVLSRKGVAIDMSKDHRPIYPSERRRVEELGGYIEDGYLNGVLSVSRALGDWDLKLPSISSSPLIADPEFQQMVLTEDDEFLIIGCDGIWDVMSSQQAVSLVRCGLSRHDDPEQCARDLVMEALRLNTFDNLTVIVVCFSSFDHWELSPPRQPKLRCCSLSAEAICGLRSLLDGSASS